MDDRYSAKTITGTNWVRYDIHIYAKKKNARLILCFHVGTGKNVYIVLSGSPRQSSMALAGGLRGNRKGLYRLHLACLWWSSRLYSCWASSLYLWTRVSREHRRSCTHTDTVHFNRHWRHFRHGLQYLQKTLTWSHALDNRGVSDPWGGSQCRSSELSSVGEEPSNYSVLWECLYIALESLFCLRII